VGFSYQKYLYFLRVVRANGNVSTLKEYYYYLTICNLNLTIAMLIIYQYYILRGFSNLIKYFIISVN